MSDKKGISQLIKRVSKQTQTDDHLVSSFITTLFNCIEKELIANSYIKIDGLGIFRIIKSASSSKILFLGDTKKVQKQTSIILEDRKTSSFERDKIFDRNISDQRYSRQSPEMSGTDSSSTKQGVLSEQNISNDEKEVLQSVFSTPIFTAEILVSPIASNEIIEENIIEEVVVEGSVIEEVSVEEDVVDEHIIQEDVVESDLTSDLVIEESIEPDISKEDEKLFWDDPTLSETFDHLHEDVESDYLDNIISTKTENGQLESQEVESIGFSEMNERPKVIQITNLNKTYYSGAPLHVLKGINIEVERGEFLSIMGASGSGKSTLLNILGILDNYDTGEYYLDNLLVKNLSETKAAEIRNKKIGFIFQAFNLISFKNALENVALPLYYQGVSRKQRNALALEYLDKMGLKNHAHHMPNQLSGGQKQRVAIARALIARPQIILADEPTGALDSKTSKEVMELLRAVNQQDNITMLIVTHENAVAEATDRIIHIKDGLIGSIEVRNNQSTNYV